MRIYKELKKKPKHQDNSLIEPRTQLNSTTEQNLESSKEAIERARTYFQKCSIPADNREMQAKTTLGFHFIPITKSISGDTNNNKAFKEVGQRKLSYAIGRSVN